MSRKLFTNEELINELQRFYNENGRVPKQSEMTNKNGYPSFWLYQKYFGSFNNGVETAGYRPYQTNDKRTGLETCCKCGSNRKQISFWITKGLPKGQVICNKCHQKSKSDYMNGNLDVNTKAGRGRLGEILVVKTLEIGDEHDCNLISWGHKIDLYHSEYKKIDVKTSLLSYERNTWQFTFNAKKEVDTYICVGLSSNRKLIEHVWIVPNVGEIRSLQIFGITNSYRPLLKRKHWEVNSKPYNEMWQEMLLNYKDDKCNVFKQKSKDGYVEPIKNSNIVCDAVKKVEQVIDKAQQRLVDF